MAKKKKERIFQFGFHGMDTNLLVVLFFIMIFGFIMIYSASYYTAGMSKVYKNDPMFLLKSQIIYSLLGIVAMFVVANINYHIWRHFAVIGYAFCLALVLLLRTPLGVTVKGATRWLRIGPIQFQVAEPIKLIMIIFLATLIVAKGSRLKSWGSMIRILIPTVVMSLLLLVLSDNMSTAAILLGWRTPISVWRVSGHG